MDRLIVITADTHAGASPEQYLHYLEEQFRPEYEEALKAGTADVSRMVFDTAWEDGGMIFSRDTLAEYHSRKGMDRDIGGGSVGQWDSSFRAKQLEDDGVVAEVIFPNASPFMMLGFPEPGRQRELVVAGMHAYNRWIAEFCAELPGRRAGLAMVDIYDVEGAVAITEWAAKVGLKGLMLPYGEEAKDMPLYDPRLEPLWSAAEANNMPVHVHAGSPSSRRITDRLLFMKLMVVDTFDVTRNQVGYVIMSGVLERHPGLKFVITEAEASWIPTTLKSLDRAYHSGTLSYIRQGLSMPPSEYWHRQCYVGASNMSAEEVDMRHDIGIGNMMFGNDYPHLEGSYPNTLEWLQATAGGIPEKDLRRIVGENAAEVYQFDLDKLRGIAERVGPKVSDFAERRISPALDARLPGLVEVGPLM